MYSLLELTKNYIFCNNCGKCYIYKGSYEKHNKSCLKKIEEAELKNNTNMTDAINTANVMSFVDYNKMVQYNQHNQHNVLFETICSIYLFIVFLLLGFIKSIIIGF